MCHCSISLQLNYRDVTCKYYEMFQLFACLPWDIIDDWMVWEMNWMQRRRTTGIPLYIEHALRIWWGKTQIAGSARKLGNYSFKISGKQFQLENNLNPLEFSITSHLIQYMKHGVLISGRSSYYLRRSDLAAGQLCQSFGTNDWLWLIYILCM